MAEVGKDLANKITYWGLQGALSNINLIVRPSRQNEPQKRRLKKPIKKDRQKKNYLQLSSSYPVKRGGKGEG